ncbi:MAG: hypothetical protein JWQ71_2730 [Pedosphaera sp.]|nr:hypothetical protein [Pedosphaera sp.]
MSNSFLLFRSLVIYGICLPLAIFLGYLLATPLDIWTLGAVGLVFVFLSVPLFLRWHYPWLILCWNLNAVVFFLPGKPQFSLMMIPISISVSILHYILNRKLKFLQIPSLTRPLCFLTVVVLATALLTGGIGLNAFGGENIGGRRYISLLVGIAGYFALTSQKIPSQKVHLYVGLYFLSALTAAISNLAYVINPAFTFIFLLFPTDAQGIQALAQDSIGYTGTYIRWGGLATASISMIFLMLVKYGVTGIFDLRKYWRLTLLICLLVITLLGGFRSMLITFLLIFAILFYLEGLMKSPLLPIFTLVAILGGTLTISMVEKLPLSVQRAFSFLPIKVDPIAEMDAKSSSEWRLDMWKQVLPEVPRYLLLGKGYSMSASELSMVRSGMTRENAAGAALAGDYHNGPLSLVMPFGIWGVGGFIWFLVASLRVLHRNYRYGDPAYQRINTFLLAYFFVKTIIFFVIFGSLYSDMALFTGAIGLSVAINGGVRSAAPVPVVKQVLNKFKLAQAAQ